MSWIVSLLIFAGFAALWWHRQRTLSAHLDRLEGVLREMAEGRAPGSVVFSDAAGNFARLTPLLDRVAAEHAELRTQVTRDAFNLQSILSSMQEGVMVVDAQHGVRMVNRSFHTLFKIAGDPQQQSVLATLREAAFDELVSAALKTGEAQAGEVELGGAKPRRQVAVHANPIRDEAGGAGAVLIFRDITRLRQLEEVRREFVANVSHELRTPLSIFLGYVEALGDRPAMPEDERVEIYDVLRRHSRRLNALLEDLLILARLESRDEQLVREPLDVGEMLRTLARDWSQRMKRKKVALHLDLAPDLPRLAADRLRLEQVFSNLLDNAVNYTEPGGTVTLRAAAEDGGVVFRIEDTGVGIPPGDIPLIFERFYRADRARSREAGGTGLGLSIVKHIVQAHGGEVSAESTYGKGTAIVLRLPRVELGTSPPNPGW